MNFELLQILLDIALITAASYLIIIAAFTFGLYNLEDFFYVSNKKLTTKVSVLIAAKNEEDNILGLLKSLYNQTFPKEYYYLRNCFHIIIIFIIFKLNILNSTIIHTKPEKFQNFSHQHSQKRTCNCTYKGNIGIIHQVAN